MLWLSGEGLGIWTCFHDLDHQPDWPVLSEHRLLSTLLSGLLSTYLLKLLKGMKTHMPQRLFITAQK